MNMGAALWLARKLGPKYRASWPSADWGRAPDRIFIDQCSAQWDDDGCERDVLMTSQAVIIRPAKREVSLIEALHWAAQDESREFHSGQVAYRVRGGEPQRKHCNDNGNWHCNDNGNWYCNDNGNWSRAITVNWFAIYAINDGWEDVTAQVQVEA